MLVLCVHMVAAQETLALHVPADYPTIAAAIAAAPDNALIEVAAGEYAESLTITRPLTLRGAGETILRGVADAPVIHIRDTHAVTIEGLTISGGQYGVSVLRSRRVTIRDNLITANRLLGVRVRMASAYILDNTISETQAPYGRGVHITNTNGYPESRIIGNIIVGNALAGITTNMASTVYIADNSVTDNAQRGIAITEMSRAVVAHNHVERNGENGIYVTDQSTAIVCENMVMDSHFAAIQDSARYGNGIAIDYGAQAELRGNTVTGSANYGISVLESSWVALNANSFTDNAAGMVWVSARAQITNDATLPEGCT